MDPQLSTQINDLESSLISSVHPTVKNQSKSNSSKKIQCQKCQILVDVTSSFYTSCLECSIHMCENCAIAHEHECVDYDTFNYMFSPASGLNVEKCSEYLNLKVQPQQLYQEIMFRISKMDLINIKTFFEFSNLYLSSLYEKFLGRRIKAQCVYKAIKNQNIQKSEMGKQWNITLFIGNETGSENWYFQTQDVENFFCAFSAAFICYEKQNSISFTLINGESREKIPVVWRLCREKCECFHYRVDSEDFLPNINKNQPLNFELTLTLDDGLQILKVNTKEEKVAYLFIPMIICFVILLAIVVAIVLVVYALAFGIMIVISPLAILGGIVVFSFPKFVLYLWFSLNGIAVIFHIYPISIYVAIFFLLLGFGNLSFLDDVENPKPKLNLAFLLLAGIGYTVSMELLPDFTSGFTVFLTGLFVVILLVFGVLSANYYRDMATNFQRLTFEKFFNTLTYHQALLLQDSISDNKTVVKDAQYKTFLFEFGNNTVFLLSLVITVFSSVIDFQPLTQYFGDGQSALVTLFNGYGYPILFSLIFFVQFAIFLCKITQTIKINHVVEEVIQELENGSEVLKFVSSAPESVLLDNPILKTFPEDQLIQVSKIVLTEKTLSLKYSKTYKKETCKIIKGIKHQLIYSNETDGGKKTYKDLTRKISWIASKSQARAEMIKKNYKEMSSIVEYKFLGIFKVNQYLLLKLVVALGTAVGSYLLTVL